MKSAQSIYYLIGAAILIIVVNTVFFLQDSSRNKTNYENGKKKHEVIENANLLLAFLKDAETSQRGYLLSNDTTYLLPYRTVEKKIRNSYLSLHFLTSSNMLQRDNLLSLDSQIRIKQEELSESIDLYKKKEYQKVRELTATGTGKRSMENIEVLIQRVIDTENGGLLKNKQAIDAQTNRIQLFSVISNWILLVCVISSLIIIIQSREQINVLFKEVEDKSSLLESQKNELQSLSQDLIKQNHELEQFAYVASHDLRSPGVNLNALLQLYENAPDEEEKTGLMKVIKEVSANLVIKLDDLIDILRSKHESYAVHEQLTFDNIYNKVIKNLSADIKRTRAQLTSNFTAAEKIQYPKSYLESILQNLLSNAIKYRSCKRDLLISIRTYRLSNKIFLEVEDNGIGIDLNKHGDNIFGIYQTFHDNDDSKGVGLYITKAQVVAMGGNIEVKSIPDQGTTFTIIFN